MKIILKMLAGAVIGFFAMYMILGLNLEIEMKLYSYELTLLFITITGLLLLLSIVGYFQIKSAAKKKIEGDEEDARDEWMYKRFADVTLAVNTSMFFGLLSLSIAVITDQSLVLVFGSLLITLASLCFTFITADIMRIVYPERELPSISDKQYANKLMNIADDGEKHVIFQGLFRSFSSTNALLQLAVILLIGYSVVTKTSQLFGIFLLIGILVISNMQYLLTIRNK